MHAYESYHLHASFCMQRTYMHAAVLRTIQPLPVCLLRHATLNSFLERNNHDYHVVSTVATWVSSVITLETHVCSCFESIGIVLMVAETNMHMRVLFPIRNDNITALFIFEQKLDVPWFQITNPPRSSVVVLTRLSFSTIVFKRTTCSPFALGQTEALTSSLSRSAFSQSWRNLALS